MFFHRESTSERIDRLKTLLALCELNEQYMQSVNEYYREHGTVQGYPGIMPDVVKIIDDGIKSGEFPDGLPYSNHDLLHDYYEIQRLKREIKTLENRMDQFVGWIFPGGEAVINTEENRLQFKFDKGISTIQQVTLRQYGFSWSEVGGVWERRLGRDAIHAAARIKFVRPPNGVSPEKLQPYAQKEHGRGDR